MNTDQIKLNNAIGSEGASPIIRVPYAEEWMIKRALDAGAHGIMTPMCHSEVSPTNTIAADSKFLRVRTNPRYRLG